MFFAFATLDILMIQYDHFSGRSSDGRTPGSGLGGRWFKSSRPDQKNGGGCSPFFFMPYKVHLPDGATDSLSKREVFNTT